MRRTRILLLGGTTEARQLAERLAMQPEVDVLLSLAGRTEHPLAQPVPVRSGGFGGVDGLVQFLREGRFDLLIDATHPFAARISANAAKAAARLGLDAFRLSRPPWKAVDGDIWMPAANVDAAIALCGPKPRRIFLAIGRQEAAAAQAAPHHFYLLRMVEPLVPGIPLTDSACITDRGPFSLDREIALLGEHRIDIVITKNSGGTATYGKIEAARRLCLPVIMIERPHLPSLPLAGEIERALERISHLTASLIERGV